MNTRFSYDDLFIQSATQNYETHNLQPIGSDNPVPILKVFLINIISYLAYCVITLMKKTKTFSPHQIKHVVAIMQKFNF